MDAPTWNQALVFAIGPGAAVIAGIIISVAIEYVPSFQALAEKWKVLVFIVLCQVVPLAATILAIATGEFGVWGDVAGTWWPAVWSGLSAAGFGTLFHAWVPTPLRKAPIQ